MYLKNNKRNFTNKKLLILAGAHAHCKLVEAANNLGIYTIVVDNLIDAPAKKLADESWNIDINNISEIVDKCKNEKVDGVIAGWIDPAQIPYVNIATELGLPCYGKYQQFIQLTNKKLFKRECQRYGINIITTYKEEDINKSFNDYPLLIKPANSRGSRGQTICSNYSEFADAISFAKKNSSDNDIIIEKYVQNGNEFQVTYFFINGKPYLIRTADSFTGNKHDNLDRVVVKAKSPSRYTNKYINLAHKKVLAMLSDFRIMNGPVFMQGFYLDNEFYFFDPGYRFPGVEYERIIKHIFNIDFMELLVKFALSGKFHDVNIPDDMYNILGKKATVFFPLLREGIIKSIVGIDQIKDTSMSLYLRNICGSKIINYGDIRQRFAEICSVFDTEEARENFYKKFYSSVSVIDNNGKEMLIYND